MKIKTKWGIGVLGLVIAAAIIWAENREPIPDQNIPSVKGQIAEQGINTVAKADIWRPNLLMEINKFRVANNISELRLSELLNKSAQSKADLLAERNEFRHGPENLMKFIDAFTNKIYSAYGENLALWPLKSNPTEKDTVIAWEKSDLHRKVLLNKVYTDMGVGLAKHPQGVVVVLHLGAVEI